MSKDNYKQFVKQTIPEYIIDTDIGDDIDDAFAIALAIRLHKKKAIRILFFITSGHGNSEYRARLIHILWKAEGILQDAPIFRGMTDSDQMSNCNYMALGAFGPKQNYPTLESRLSIIQTNIHERNVDIEDKINVLCIGPLDNIKKMNLPPEKVRLILMGGCFGRSFDGSKEHIPEYNVRNGIESWKWVLQTYDDCTIVPLDSAGLGRLSWSNPNPRAPFIPDDFNYKDKIKHIRPNIQIQTQQLPIVEQLRIMYTQWYLSNLKKHIMKKNKSMELPHILKDAQGRDISLACGVNSNIQFDSVALFYSLYPEQFKCQQVKVHINDKGVTEKLPTNAFQEKIPEWYNTIVAIEWKGNGLQKFQQWVGHLLEFPIY